MVTDELVNLVKNLDEAEDQLDILRRDIMRRVFADFGDRLVKFPNKCYSNRSKYKNNDFKISTYFIAMFYDK